MHYKYQHIFERAGQLIVLLPVVIASPNFLSTVSWIGTINYSAPLYLLAAVRMTIALPRALVICFNVSIKLEGAAMQDKHSGTQVLATLKMTGDLCFGAVVAGVAVTLAHLPGVAYTGVLCLFAALGLLLFSYTRARSVNLSCLHSQPCQVLIHLITFILSCSSWLPAELAFEKKSL